MNPLRKSLRTRIVLSVGLGLAVLLGLMTFLSAQALTAATDELTAQWRSEVQFNAGHLYGQIEQEELTVDLLAAALTRVPAIDQSQALALMRDRAHSMDVFDDGLFWVSTSGEVRAHVPSTVAVEDLFPADLTQCLPAPGKPDRLSGLLHSKTGSPLATYAVSMGPAGALLAVSDLANAPDLSDYLLPRSAGGHAAVEDGTGWVLASNEKDLLFTQNEHAQWVAAAIQGGAPVVGTTTGDPVETYRHLMAFAPIGDTGWGLVYGQSSSLALAAHMELNHRLLLLGLLAVIFVIAYSWWDTTTLILPLQRLTGHAERIASGDLTGRVEVRREDEVGVLAKAFEAMQGRLHSSREALNQALNEALHLKEETSSLYAVSQEILRPRGEGSALQIVAEQSRELVRARAAAVCLTTPEGVMKPVALSGLVTDPPPDGPGWVTVPIAAPDLPPGKLCVAPPDGRELSDQEVRLLAGLANLAALAVAHDELHARSRRLVVYAERERIARDLHDGISQSLSYLYSQLEWLREYLHTLAPEQLQNELRSLAEVTSVAFDEARESIYSLRAGNCDRQPLPSAIAGCARDFTARSGIHVNLETDAMVAVALSSEVEAQLVRVVQEALANVAKHSGATLVTISASVQDHSLQVVIRDNGVGFDRRAPRSGRRSFGLEMMRERAESIGGSVEICSRQGEGTTVTVGIPTEKEVDPHGENPRAAG